jgi:hypothetical protein
MLAQLREPTFSRLAPFKPGASPIIEVDVDQRREIVDEVNVYDSP